MARAAKENTNSKDVKLLFAYDYFKKDLKAIGEFMGLTEKATTKRRSRLLMAQRELYNLPNLNTAKKRGKKTAGGGPSGKKQKVQADQIVEDEEDGDADEDEDAEEGHIKEEDIEEEDIKEEDIEEGNVEQNA